MDKSDRQTDPIMFADLEKCNRHVEQWTSKIGTYPLNELYRRIPVKLGYSRKQYVPCDKRI